VDEVEIHPCAAANRERHSWSRTRRVVGKAEHTLEGANPRFIVTSLKRSRTSYDTRGLYEQLYCARGEAENCIGEQFELFADRASSATMAANQLRMWFSAMAYELLNVSGPIASSRKWVRRAWENPTWRPRL